MAIQGKHMDLLIMDDILPDVEYLRKQVQERLMMYAGSKSSDLDLVKHDLAQHLAGMIRRAAVQPITINVTVKLKPERHWRGVVRDRYNHYVTKAPGASRWQNTQAICGQKFVRDRLRSVMDDRDLCPHCQAQFVLKEV